MSIKSLLQKNLKFLVVALVAALIVGVVLAHNTVLKAEEPVPEAPVEQTEAPAEVPVEAPVEEQLPEVIEVVVPETPVEPAPVVEPAPEPVAEPVAEPEPKPVEEPVEQPVEQPVEEPVEQPVEEPAEEEEAEEPAEAPAPERKVRVDYEIIGGEFTGLGTQIKLYPILSGFEGLTPSYQWQYSKDGHTWHDMDGATGETYTYSVDEDNYTYSWRVEVTA